MKKLVMTFFLITVFLSSGLSANAFAKEPSSKRTSIQTLSFSTAHTLNDKTTPEPSAPTSPEPSTPEPEPSTPVAPEPSTPAPSTPDPESSYNNSYDDEPTYYDNMPTPQSRNSTPEETITNNEPASEKAPQQQAPEAYPVTLALKDTTVDVSLASNAYTTTTVNHAITIEFNNDALNAAITAATKKLNEKNQGESGKLTKAVIKVPVIDTKNTADPNISLRIPAQALKNMLNANIFLDISINKDSMRFSSGLLKSDLLKNLADNDKLMIELKKGINPKNTSYDLSDMTLTSIGTPFSIEVATLKATGAKTTLNTFETPLEFNLAIDDAVTSKQSNNKKTELIVCDYKTDRDKLNPMKTVYHSESKIATFSATMPGNYIVMLKTTSKGFNPLFMIIPIIIVAIISGIFAFFKFKKRRNRNIFGDYDD